MPKKNILHVIDKLTMDGENPSSCANLITEWASLHGPDFNVDIAVLSKSNAASRTIESRGIKVHYINNFKLSPFIIKKLINLIDVNNYDILHLHGYASANFGRIAARLRSIKNIVHEHAILKIQPHQFLADKMLKNLTDHAIAVSTAVKEFMHEGRSVPNDKISVIGNGINLEKYQPIPQDKKAKIRDSLGIPVDAFIIGTITRLHEAKGNKYLIHAAKTIIDKKPDTYFVIAGDGPLKQELMNLARDLGIEKKILFPGYVSPIAELISIFDIVSCPSLNEGFCLAMAEAMAMAKPVIASNVGGMVDLAIEGKTALFVPAKDSQAIAERALDLMDNPARRLSIAEMAKVKAREFSLRTNVEKLESLYQSI